MGLFCGGGHRIETYQSAAPMASRTSCACWHTRTTSSPPSDAGKMAATSTAGGVIPGTGRAKVRVHVGPRGKSEAYPVRDMHVHQDAVTGVDHAFVSIETQEIFSGGYEPDVPGASSRPRSGTSTVTAGSRAPANHLRHSPRCAVHPRRPRSRQPPFTAESRRTEVRPWGRMTRPGPERTMPWFIPQGNSCRWDGDLATEGALPAVGRTLSCVTSDPSVAPASR